MRLHSLDESHALDELAQLARCDRSGNVRPKHLATQCDVDLEHLGAERHRREAGIHAARVIREPNRTTVTLAEEPEQVEPYLLGRARVLRRALQHSKR